MKPVTQEIPDPDAAPPDDAFATALPYIEEVTDSLESGILLMDASLHVLMCSRAMATTLGRPADSIVGMDADGLQKLVGSLVDDPPPVIRESRLLPQESRIVCEEFELTRPARSVVRWVARRVNRPRDGVIVVCNDITSEVDLVAAYERLSQTDRLTGLANRRGAEVFIRRETSKLRRYGGQLSFLLIDVDHFKKVNDTYGHGMGDQVLRQVAQTLMKVMRVCDFAARWGGEEFLCVLPNTTLQGAQLCAERIRVAVEAMVVEGGPKVTVSLGAAEMTVDEDPQKTITRADDRLYEAKGSGRNCWR